MKKNFLMMAFVSLFTVVAISSCNKDDEDENSGRIGNTLTVIVDNGSSLNGKIDTVKVEIWYEKSTTDTTWNEYLYVAAYALYNNGFTLNLPETVSDTYLEAFDDVPDGITVSNRNVKTRWAYIYAYKASSDVGSFYPGTGTTDTDWEGDLVYSNGDLSITGSYTDTIDRGSDGEKHTEIYTEKYNVHLKKGWNLVYEKETEKGNDTYEEEITTTAPSGVKWYYYDYSTKSLSSRVRKVPFLSSKRK